MYLKPKITMTYEEWRKTNDPWNYDVHSNFIGNLDPVTDANVIDAIHSIIDEYLAPRHLGVRDAKRFEILFHIKLLEVETQFFNLLKIKDIYLSDDDLKYNSTSETNTSGNNNSESEATSTTNSTFDSTNGSNDTSTNSSTDKNYNSEYPQSNVSPTGEFSWDYVTSANEGNSEYTSKNNSSSSSNGKNDSTTTSNNNTTTGYSNETTSKTSGERAMMLDTAINYIKGITSAWAFLLPKLEVMFLAEYEDEEGDY